MTTVFKSVHSRAAKCKFNSIKNSLATISGGSRSISSSTPAQYDLAIIGGGPGGYVAAIKAAQAKLKVACIEQRGALGGTCLNVGCIPTKAMLQMTHKSHEAKHSGSTYGYTGAENIKPNYTKMLSNRSNIIKALNGGIEGLFKRHKIDYIKGKASFLDHNTLSVLQQQKEQQTISAKHIIIATGSEPSSFPNKNVLQFDEKRVLSSTGILGLSSIPKKITVIGGGAIGLEFATVFNRLGSQVEIIEFMDQIAVGFDKDAADALAKTLTKSKIKIHLKHKVVDADLSKKDGPIEVRAEGPNGKNLTVASDVVLVCVGRRPYTIGLNLEAIGVKSDKAGRIEVDNQYRTNVSNVRAIGDVIKGPMLAHKAEEDGVACVEAILGHGPGMFDYNLVPGVIYTHPELATVGKTEAALKAEKIPFQKGVFPYMANSRARCNQETDGFVKVLRDTKTDKILGGSILGATAGESIQELVVAIKAGMTAGDLGELVHAHPTLSEATKEAALKAQNNIAIHI